jgi:hypothetical protein
MQTINSSKIEWEIFTAHKDFPLSYCADGDGFVTLEQYEDDNGGTYWVLCDQGSPIADINCLNENHSLADALEIAQNYLAATYNEIFKDLSYKLECDKQVSEDLKKIGL